MVDRQRRTGASRGLSGLLCSLLLAAVLAAGCGGGGQSPDLTKAPDGPGPGDSDRAQTPASSSWVPAPTFLAASGSLLTSSDNRGPDSRFRETLPEEAFQAPSEQATKQVLADLHECLAVELELEQGLPTTLPHAEAEVGSMPAGGSP